MLESVEDYIHLSLAHVLDCLNVPSSMYPGETLVSRCW